MYLDDTVEEHGFDSTVEGASKTGKSQNHTRVIKSNIEQIYNSYENNGQNFVLNFISSV
jgi:hypothetical protein